MRFSIGKALHRRTLPKRSPPLCPVCNEAVDLTVAKTDEDGRAIHEECYLQKLHAKGPPESVG